MKPKAKNSPAWGGARPNSGPAPQIFHMRRGERLAWTRLEADGKISIGGFWTVVEVSRTTVTFEDDNGVKYQLAR